VSRERPRDPGLDAAVRRRLTFINTDHDAPSSVDPTRRLMNSGDSTRHSDVIAERAAMTEIDHVSLFGSSLCRTA
jgi:hypothetical protein